MQLKRFTIGLTAIVLALSCGVQSHARTRHESPQQYMDQLKFTVCQDLSAYVAGPVESIYCCTLHEVGCSSFQVVNGRMTVIRNLVQECHIGMPASPAQACSALWTCMDDNSWWEEFIGPPQPLDCGE